MILAIDPGTARCGWVYMDCKYKPVNFGIDSPKNMRKMVHDDFRDTVNVIEKPV